MSIKRIKGDKYRWQRGEEEGVVKTRVKNDWEEKTKLEKKACREI